jgi:hypothetical protein
VVSIDTYQWKEKTLFCIISEKEPNLRDQWIRPRSCVNVWLLDNQYLKHEN